MQEDTLINALKMQRDWQPLFDVVTVSEAARMWNMNRKTIIRALDRPGVRFRKSGGVILINFNSLNRLWGDPVDTYDL